MDIFNKILNLPTYSKQLTVQKSDHLHNLVYKFVIYNDIDGYNILYENVINKIDLTHAIEKACELGNISMLKKFITVHSFAQIIINNGINIMCFYGQFMALKFIIKCIRIDFFDKLLIMMIENYQHILNNNKHSIIEYLFNKLPKTISLLEFLNTNISILEIFYRNRNDFDQYYGALFTIACECDNIELLIWLENKKYVYDKKTALFIASQNNSYNILSWINLLRI